MLTYVPVVAFLLGLAAITVGVLMLSVPAGLIVGGSLSTVGAYVWPWIELIPTTSSDEVGRRRAAA